MSHPNSFRFHQLLDIMGETHDLKQADYGRADDPFANVRASEDFGMPGWVGALVRANDKMRRLQKAASQVLAGEPVNMALDGPLDDLLDLAVYAVIARVLYEEDLPDLTEERLFGSILTVDPALRSDEIRVDKLVVTVDPEEQYLASMDEVKTARENLNESIEAWKHNRDFGYNE